MKRKAPAVKKAAAKKKGVVATKVDEMKHDPIVDSQASGSQVPGSASSSKVLGSQEPICMPQGWKQPLIEGWKQQKNEKIMKNNEQIIRKIMKK